MKIMLLLGLLSFSIQLAFASADIQYGSLPITNATPNQLVLTYKPRSSLILPERLKTIVLTDSAPIGQQNNASTPLGTFTLTLNGRVVFSQVILPPGPFGASSLGTSPVPGLIVIPLGDGLIFSNTDLIKVLFTPVGVPNLTVAASFFLDTAQY